MDANKPLSTINKKQKKPDRTLCLCSSEMLPGDMMCHSTDVEVLAFADTVEDIVSKNKMSRYLKSAYETQSLLDEADCASFSSNDSDDDDDFTLNTFDNTVDHTIDELALNDNGTVEIPIIIGPAAADDINCVVLQQENQGNNALAVTPGLYPHNSLCASRQDTKECNRTASIALNTTLDTTMESSASLMELMELKFSPWHSKLDNEGTNTVNTDSTTKEDAKTGGGVNDGSIEVIGMGLKKKKSFRSRVSLKKSNRDNDSAGETIEETLKREKRRQKLKSILLATAKNNNSNINNNEKSKKYAWKRTMTSALDSIRSSKKKP